MCLDPEPKERVYGRIEAKCGRWRWQGGEDDGDHDEEIWRKQGGEGGSGEVDGDGKVGKSTAMAARSGEGKLGKAAAVRSTATTRWER
ncbi:Os10g0182750 [Oryza sativa Japonica Group]|uniref:Os10g0182750 protein n=1 Tax=Oryza sativa subsp. japonica TaxID=39947 RepID=A0A0P0XT21_ORYSJ|nr:Os10g0182750 [Oryza sativa Japonica Group]